MPKSYRSLVCNCWRSSCCWTPSHHPGVSTVGQMVVDNFWRTRKETNRMSESLAGRAQTDKTWHKYDSQNPMRIAWTSRSGTRKNYTGIEPRLKVFGMILCFKTFFHLLLTIRHTNPKTRWARCREKCSQPLTAQSRRQETKQTGREAGGAPSRIFATKVWQLSGEQAGRQAHVPG